MRRKLIHGLVAGGAGGAAMAVVLALAGEGPIGRAVALESAAAGSGAEVFGRGAQQAGGALAAVLFGLAVGAVFAVAHSLVGPAADDRDWRASVRLAGAGLVTLFVVPFLKYPPNPPAVGDPATIGQRTWLYLVLVAWSVVATWAARRAWLALGERGMADHLRTPATAAGYAALVAAGCLALPGSGDAVDLPAQLVWEFRLASLAGAVALWGVVGTVFGWLRLAAAREPSAAV